MALSRNMRTCLHSGRLAALAILLSGGIVLQILACALYNNWWPMLTVLMYLVLPMPLKKFLNSDSPSIMSNEGDWWVNFTKFLTGTSIVGSITILLILKHAGIIGWGALKMELSSFAVLGLAIMWFLQMNAKDAEDFEDAEALSRSMRTCLYSGSLAALVSGDSETLSSRSMRTCLHNGCLVVLVSGGIVLQILACAPYNNWWPMLTVLMYLILPMPVIFFLGSDSPSIMSNEGDGKVGDEQQFKQGSRMINNVDKHASVQTRDGLKHYHEYPMCLTSI
ncbi:uncharacterized protein [Aegilops tauschii subsp. strangulata]|uniref:uncharacterized protein isoform X2 n=1 Tax=Aegilops tauschii subsp. strangulata TaxID=200361 RepID=UPI001ABC4AF2|nr:uncharacterized protein LOC109775065 isoform X2 [Aegilops tauschii subsp. strangulata]